MNYKKGVTVNKKHKDSLFRIIFKEKKELLNLYNALADTDYCNLEDLTITTCENVVYLHMKDDISFIIDDYLNLYEHQSTYNPNMPLRGLIYITDLYKPMVAGPKLYSKSLIKIPNPKYVVFYNGTAEMPDRKELRLSDAFIHRQSGGDVEVVVHMLNINYGHNRDLMEKCKKLWEYSAFIAAIRKYLEAEYELETAVQLAMDECIRNDILAEILRKERAVVMSSILEEFDEAAYADMLREEGYEEGIEQGIEQGKREMLFNMLKNGMDIKQIAQITEMSEKEVETIEEERNKIESGKK